MSSFTQIDEGQEGEEQGNKKLKSCQCFICTKQTSFMEFIFLVLVFFLSAVAHKLCASGKAKAARGFLGPSRRQEAFDRHLNELRQLIMDKD